MLRKEQNPRAKLSRCSTGNVLHEFSRDSNDFKYKCNCVSTIIKYTCFT